MSIPRGREGAHTKFVETQPLRCESVQMEGPSDLGRGCDWGTTHSRLVTEIRIASDAEVSQNTYLHKFSRLSGRHFFGRWRWNESWRRKDWPTLETPFSARLSLFEGHHLTLSVHSMKFCCSSFPQIFVHWTA